MSAQVRYKEIYEALTREIADGILVGGERLPSENQLAKRFGVTRQTVLKALSIMKIQGSIRSERGCGTFVNAPYRPSRENHRKQLAFISANQQESFGNRAMISIEAEARRQGFQLMTCITRYSSEREAEYLRWARDTGVDGIILLPFMDSNRELAMRIAAEIPMICFDIGFEGSDIPLVSADNFQASYQATEYLLELGHRRIGMILNSREALHQVNAVQLRFNGYQQALLDHGIAPDQDLVSFLGNVEWSEMSYQEKQNQGQIILLMGLAMLFAYFFLVAQYESWTIPVPVMLSVVFALLGAILGLYLTGISLNIYAQLGMVMLIGLAAKNAILMVEFSKRERERGIEIRQAALNGMDLRFRAVMMTAWSFLFGVLPLMLATGAGASAQRSIGVATFSGMLFSTLVGISFIPALYAAAQQLRERLKGLAFQRKNVN